jgi:sigma-B regulation protein RsbU (phosphoserine phosphatase)
MKISVIIFSLILLNTSYYALFVHKRKRMLYFVIAFEGVAFLLILDAFFYNELFVSFSRVTFNLFNIYYEMVFAIVAIAIMIASLTDLNATLNDKHFRYYKLVTIVELFVMIVAVYLVMSNYRMLVNYEALLFVSNIICFGALGVSIYKYIGLYYMTKNRYARYFASGLVIMLAARIYRFVFVVDEYQLLVELFVFAVGIYALNHATFRYNIGIPYTQLINAKRQINLYAENLEKIVDQRTKQIATVNDQLVKEIDNAKLIQQSLLPPKRFEFVNTHFISEYIPCERLSGDFYDIYPIDSENIGMYILDVSGHGVSAALMTMFCNNYIKSSERLIKRYRGLKPHRNIQNFYDEFNKMKFPDEMHMVIFFATFNVKTRILKYTNGGINNFPIVFRKNGKVEMLDDNIGFPICKMADIYLPEYVSSSRQLEVGDRVLFFTDGLTDEKKTQIMNEEELIEGFINHRNDSLEELNGAIRRKIDETEKIFEDDITYFIMEIKE